MHPSDGGWNPFTANNIPLKVRQTSVKLHVKVQSKLPQNSPCINEYPEKLLNFTSTEISSTYSRMACNFYCRIAYVAGENCNCSTAKLGFELYDYENLEECTIGNYRTYNDTSPNATKIPCIINRSNWLSDFQNVFREDSVSKYCGERCTYQCEYYSYVSNVYYELPFRGSLECPDDHPEGQLKLTLDDFVEEYGISSNYFMQTNPFVVESEKNQR